MGNSIGIITNVTLYNNLRYRSTTSIKIGSAVPKYLNYRRITLNLSHHS